MAAPRAQFSVRDTISTLKREAEKLSYQNNPVFTQLIEKLEIIARQVQPAVLVGQAMPDQSENSREVYKIIMLAYIDDYLENRSAPLLGRGSNFGTLTKIFHNTFLEPFKDNQANYLKFFTDQLWVGIATGTPKDIKKPNDFPDTRMLGSIGSQPDDIFNELIAHIFKRKMSEGLMDNLNSERISVNSDKALYRFGNFEKVNAAWNRNISSNFGDGEMYVHLELSSAKDKQSEAVSTTRYRELKQTDTLLVEIRKKYWLTNLINLLRQPLPQAVQSAEANRIGRTAQELASIQDKNPFDKVHSIVMKLYIDAYLTDRHKAKGWGSNKGPYLQHIEKLLESFRQQTRNTMFYGENGITFHDQIFSSVSESPEEAKDLGKYLANRAIEAVANLDISNNESVAKFKDIYVNAGKAAARMGNDAMQGWNEEVQRNYAPIVPEVMLTLGNYSEQALITTFNTKIIPSQQKIKEKYFALQGHEIQQGIGQSSAVASSSAAAASTPPIAVPPNKSPAASSSTAASATSSVAASGPPRFMMGEERKKYQAEMKQKEEADKKKQSATTHTPPSPRSKLGGGGDQ
jgi:hypothetical protein